MIPHFILWFLGVTRLSNFRLIEKYIEEPAVRACQRHAQEWE